MTAVLKRRSSLDCAVEMIQSYIIDQRLQPGAALPTEHTLSQELGISRTILREAMQHFRTLGVISSKPKVGSVIVRLMPENPYEGYMPFIEAADSLRELAEVRTGLEVGLAPLMVAGVTGERLAELRACCARIEAIPDPARRGDADADFHAALLRLPNNRIAAGLIPLVVDFFGRLHRKEIEPRIAFRDVGSVDAEHRAILDALAARNAEGLSRALARHGQSYFKNDLLRSSPSAPSTGEDNP